MATICQNIKQARVSAGLTQDDMAAKLKIKRTTYANWENKTEPEMSRIVEIAGIVGRPYLELIEGLKDGRGKGKEGETVLLPNALQMLSEKVIKIEAGQEVERSLLIELLAKATGKTQIEISTEVSKALEHQISKRKSELLRGNF